MDTSDATALSHASITSTTEKATEASYVPLRSILEYEIAKSLWKFWTPAALALGTFGNIMTLVIMRRMTSSESTVNIFFTALAVTDLIVLWTGSPVMEWFIATLGVRFVNENRVLCKVYFWLTGCAGTVANWILVCLTVQRAMSIVWPHRINLLWTRRRVCWLIVGVALFLSILYSHYLFGFDLIVIRNGTAPICSMTSPDYARFVRDVFTYIELLVFCVLPFAFLATSNGVLVWKLMTSTREARKNLSAGNSQQALNRNSSANSVTFTVIIVSLTFIILNLPAGIYFIEFYISGGLYAMSRVEYAKVYLFYATSYLLLYTNSAVNFYLYCLTGRRFREEFLKIVCCGQRGTPPGRANLAKTTAITTVSLSSSSLNQPNLGSSGSRENTDQ